MRKTMQTFTLLLALLACAPAFAQEQGPQLPTHFYRVSLIVQEVDSSNKPTNSRIYTTTVSTARDSRGTIRTGSRVPVMRTGGYDYVDVGINFDVHDVHEFDRNLSLNIKADISSYTPPENSAIAPVIRHNQWESPVLIPIGKPTVIFSSDSLENKSAMQVVATATPIP
jgi:hypothetical protein